MKIAVMAAGAVGAYFGGRFASAGHDVHFVARGAHGDSIRRNGLRIESTLGDLQLPAPNVTDDPESIGPSDVVLFAVKLWDTEVAAGAARPLMGPLTRVVTLQNGVDSVERIVPILGEQAVVAGSAYIASVIAAPGLISHTSPFARLVCGRVGGGDDPQLDRFAAAARAAAIDISVSNTVELDLWKKFVFLVGLSGATASMRVPLGTILGDPVTRAFFRSLMEEVVAVGRARGVPIDSDFVDDRMAFAESTPFGFKASMLHDLERGGRLELDWLSGKVAALGKSLGIPTPANAAVEAVLRPHRMGSTPARSS